MWFNNLIVYKFNQIEPESLESAMAEHALKPCPPHARNIQGWTAPFENDILIYFANNASLICLGKEERILPKTVINQKLKEKITQMELSQGYPVKRAERTQMAEDLEFELLPQAFCVQKKLYALLDHEKKWLIINNSNINQCAQLISLLKKSIPQAQFERLAFSDQLAMRFNQWIEDPSKLPSHIQLAENCQLFALNDEKKRLNCKGYELPADEILTLLGQGLVTSELSIIWHDRIQCTLTHEFILKKLKCLDYLVDEMQDLKNHEDENEQREAEIFLLTGELRKFIEEMNAITAASGQETNQSLEACT